MGGFGKKIGKYTSIFLDPANLAGARKHDSVSKHADFLNIAGGKSAEGIEKRKSDEKLRQLRAAQDSQYSKDKLDGENRARAAAYDKDRAEWEQNKPSFTKKKPEDTETETDDAQIRFT